MCLKSWAREYIKRETRLFKLQCRAESFCRHILEWIEKNSSPVAHFKCQIKATLNASKMVNSKYSLQMHFVMEIDVCNKSTLLHDNVFDSHSREMWVLMKTVIWKVKKYIKHHEIEFHFLSLFVIILAVLKIFKLQLPREEIGLQFE